MNTVNDKFVSQDSHPQFLLTYDFNSDTLMDIAVVNSGTNNIGIFFGRPNATFAEQVTFSTGVGSHPSSIAVADLNNDGYLDIVVSNYASHTIGILLGNANGTFRDQITYPVGSSRPLKVALGDLNNDSFVDIVVVNNGTNIIGILFGSDNAMFQSQIQLSSTYDSLPTSVIVDDFNNDHFLDILIVNSGLHNIELYLGDVSASFTNRIVTSTGLGFYPYEINVKDFNHDNFLDVVVISSTSNNIRIYFGSVNGTFIEERTYSTGDNSKPTGVTLGDFNHDDRVDIVVCNSGTNNIGVFLGLGNGTFMDQVMFSTGVNSKPSSVIGGDFNKDQRLDIAVANYATNNIVVLLAYSNATFSKQKTYTSDSAFQPNSIGIGQFNNDSYSDIVVGDIVNSFVGIFMGNGDGTFSNLRTYLSDNDMQPIIVAVGDFNNDGFDDIVIDKYEVSDSTTYDDYSYHESSAIREIEIHCGNSNGVFSYLSTLNFELGIGTLKIVIYDLNNDTYLDIVIGTVDSYYIYAFLGEGKGNFTSAFRSGTSSSLSRFTVADLNHDGRPDVAVTYSTYINAYGAIGVLFGDGSGSFFNETQYSTGYYPITTGIATGDFDSDGHVDLVVANLWNHNIGIFFGFGNGSFQVQRTFTTGLDSAPSFVFVGDFNNDSIVDILFDSQLQKAVVVYPSYGNGSFADLITYPTSAITSPTSAAVADLNHDTLLDVIVVNSNDSNIGVFLDFANANFMSAMPLSTGSSPGPRFIVADDFNEDHEMDFVVANYITNNVGIFLGDGRGNFPFQSHYSTGSISSPISLSVNDFNNDHHRDIVVVNSGTDSFGILYGYGNGSLQEQTSHSLPAGSNPYSVGSGDFNKDNQQDIVIANYGSDNVAVLIQFNTGNFGKPALYSTGPGSDPHGFAVGDFNNDSRLDLVVANNGNEHLGIFFGKGNGTFSDQIFYTPSSSFLPVSVATSDFNDDNMSDVVVVDNANHIVYILLSLGNGSFTVSMVYDTSFNTWPESISTGYLNNDSQLDIVVGQFRGAQISVFLGLGNGIFSVSKVSTNSDQGGPNCVIIADLDNDNCSDVVATKRGVHVIEIMYGMCDGTFSRRKTVPTLPGALPSSLDVRDLDQNGWPDIVVLNSALSSVTVMFGHANNSFDDRMTMSTGKDAQSSTVVIVDANDDGRDDITVVNSQSSEVAIFLGYVNRTFFSQLTYSTGYNTYPVSAIFADLNDDRQLDMAVCNTKSNNFGIHLRYSGSSFVSLPAYSTGISSQPMSAVIGDFNNDTQLDVAVANSGADNLMILLGSSYGIFVNEQIYSTGNGSHPSSIAIADLNRDNYSDIVVANTGNDNIGIFLGKSDGMFLNQSIYSTGLQSQPSTVRIGDFNNDTMLDIAVANYGSNTVGAFLGYGNGNFSNQILFSIGFNSRPFALSVADMNRDNVTDIIIGGYGYGSKNIIIKLC
ncbi:unnamed protein product [Adineta ricciae]|nr:unnamed protein product [Adineta ricciae]